jgi:carboxylate-amine ligase
VRPAIEEFGEWDKVYAIAETMQQGNSAARQRDVYKRTGSLEDVVDFVVRETAQGTTAV